MILPAYVFRPGDELKVHLDEREECVLLGALDACLGAFAYFRFKVLEEVQTKDDDDDDFDNLWDVL